MDRKKLMRKLNSIGKQKFVEYFELFKEYSNGLISKNEAIEKLVRYGVSNNAGAAIRLGNAKLIFQANKEKEAIDIIVNSKKIPMFVINDARKLQNTII